MIVVAKFVNFEAMKIFVNTKTGKEIETSNPKVFENINAKLGYVAWVEADKKGAKASKPKPTKDKEPNKEEG